MIRAALMSVGVLVYLSINEFLPQSLLLLLLFNLLFYDWC